AYMPWEGFSVNLNGSKGRIELKVVEKAYINAGGNKEEEGALSSISLQVHPMFGKPYEVALDSAIGSHGGGDRALLEDLFGNPPPDPFHRAASHIDGAMSILTGIAANKSIASGREITIKELISF
ncbi:MAG: gfo/Idh/MocA family oxidoreductase, partial [Clostridiales bacterium]|nr:gfo/Idh/MocA family oxidoreductase [Clostridiales bacterium]